MASALRWMRALALASVLVGTGVAGHVAAGAAMPAPAVLALLLVLATLVLAPVLGTPASSVRVALLVIGGQALLHVSLNLITRNPAGHTGAGMVMPDGPHGSMPMSGGMFHAAAASGETSVWMGSAHVGMLLAHLVAGLLLGLWLAAGERAAWTLVRLAARPVAEAFHILLDAISALGATGAGWERVFAAPRWVWELALRSDACTGDCLSRRGPPRISVA
jgi:hypothetical protein